MIANYRGDNSQPGIYVQGTIIDQALQRAIVDKESYTRTVIDQALRTPYYKVNSRPKFIYKGQSVIDHSTEPKGRSPTKSARIAPVHGRYSALRTLSMQEQTRR